MKHQYSLTKTIPHGYLLFTSTPLLSLIRKMTHKE